MTLTLACSVARGHVKINAFVDHTLVRTSELLGDHEKSHEVHGIENFVVLDGSWTKRKHHKIVRTIESLGEFHANYNKQVCNQKENSEMYSTLR